ncbi:hypothetical protein IMZ48_44780, partial [Candidatus Bathyarchaeota archaeon]|nr:hypothetical protein [Candidatus Bathyarchaeota archaeon]
MQCCALKEAEHRDVQAYAQQCRPTPAPKARVQSPPEEDSPLIEKPYFERPERGPTDFEMAYSRTAANKAKASADRDATVKAAADKVTFVISEHLYQPGLPHHIQGHYGHQHTIPSQGGILRVPPQTPYSYLRE